MMAWRPGSRLPREWPMAFAASLFPSGGMRVGVDKRVVDDVQRLRSLGRQRLTDPQPDTCLGSVLAAIISRHAGTA